MGKFGFGKKDKSGSGEGATGEEDTNRSSLFGSRSSKHSSNSAHQSNNPYAAAAPSSGSSSNNPYAIQQQPGQQGGMPSDPYMKDSKPDPYMKDSKPDPYMKDSKSFGSGSGGLGRSDSFTPGPPPYLESPGSGMMGGGAPGGDRYGGGGNRYGPPPSDHSRYGPSGGAVPAPGGGYGGLGRTRSNETTNTEANRDALFGDASSRYQQRGPPPNAPSGGSGDGYGASSGYGSDAPGPYGGPDSNNNNYSAYGENRQLTAEEEEEEDVSAAKQQIRLMKQEDVSSTRNALRIAAQAEETGRATLERLAAQGERIHNTEKNLDLANNHNRVAEERAKELKTLNKSMFAVHVSNPFTKSDRRQRRDDDVLNKHRTEREQRDATRAAAFASKARHENTFKELRPGEPGFAEQKKSRLAERAKYQFEADSEDDAMEDEIDRNLDALGQAAGRLNAVARATGKEVDEQNRQIDKIISKVCYLLPLSFLSRVQVFRRGYISDLLWWFVRYDRGC